MRGSDPVELGLVASLNHPGGNLTGVAGLFTEIATKRLDLLRKAVPATQSIAFLGGPADVLNTQVETRLMQSAARTLGLRLQVINATTDTEIAPSGSRGWQGGHDRPARGSLTDAPARPGRTVVEPDNAHQGPLYVMSAPGGSGHRALRGKLSRLFNHLVGGDQQRFRESKTERFSGLKIEDQFELAWRLDR
jgi:ABC transporter substrate binding protein